VFLFLLILMWFLFVGQVIFALYTGWIWAKGWTGTAMFTGYMAHRDSEPFTFWLTLACYVLAAILIPIACFPALM
jgi:hypothetical protein